MINSIVRLLALAIASVQIAIALRMVQRFHLSTIDWILVIVTLWAAIIIIILAV